MPLPCYIPAFIQAAIFYNTLLGALAILAMVTAGYFYAKYKKQVIGSKQEQPGAKETFHYGEMMRILRNQEFLVNFTNYLNKSSDFPHKISNALHILGKYTGANHICIFEDTGDGFLYKNTFEWSDAGLSAQTNSPMIFDESFVRDWKKQLMKDGVFQLSSDKGMPDWVMQLVNSRKVASVLILPVYLSHDFYGVIGVGHGKAVAWDGLEIGFLKTVSTMLSNAFERRYSEEEMRNSEAKFRDLFNHSSDVVVIYNLNGDLLEVNNRACEALAFDKAELIQKKIEEIFPVERAPRTELYGNCNQQDIQVFESEFITKAGHIFPVEINSRPIIFNNKQATLCVARDISGRKEMQREILSAIIQTEEKERGRVAQDLHDGLGPMLSSLKLYVKVLGTTTDTEKRNQMLKNCNEVIDESMILIKEISNNLSPHVLDDFGLASAIQSFCKKITFTKEIDIKFDSNVFDQRFGHNVELVLFRILKELVNNTIKHALATRIEIFLLRTENMLSLIYNDNGIGFDFKKVLDNRASGMGLSNIVNRISSINGRLMFESQAEKGIQMKVEVELKPFKA